MQDGTVSWVFAIKNNAEKQQSAGVGAVCVGPTGRADDFRADKDLYYQTSASNRISKQLYSFKSPSEGQSGSKDYNIDYNTKINKAITFKHNVKNIFNQVNINGGNGTEVVNNLINGIGNAKGGVISGVDIANLLINARPDNPNSPKLMSRLTQDSNSKDINWASLRELPVATEPPKPIETQQLPGLPAGAVAPEPGAVMPLDPSQVPIAEPAGTDDKLVTVPGPGLQGGQPDPTEPPGGPIAPPGPPAPTDPAPPAGGQNPCPDPNTVPNPNPTPENPDQCIPRPQPPPGPNPLDPLTDPAAKQPQGGQTTPPEEPECTPPQIPEIDEDTGEFTGGCIDDPSAAAAGGGGDDPEKQREDADGEWDPDANDGQGGCTFPDDQQSGSSSDTTLSSDALEEEFEADTSGQDSSGNPGGQDILESESD